MPLQIMVQSTAVSHFDLIPGTLRKLAIAYNHLLISTYP